MTPIEAKPPDVNSHFCDQKYVDAADVIAYLIGTQGNEAMQIVVFDLDGTVIDSSHRHLNKPDGSIDLAHWRANCTREKIMQDSLLPLAKSMRAMKAAGHHIVICTARVVTEHDMAFIVKNDLPFDGFLSREGENDNRPDGAMKVQLLTEYVQAQGYKSIRDAGIIMFDDNLKVIAAISAAGGICINAAKENRRLVA